MTTCMVTTEMKNSCCGNNTIEVKVEIGSLVNDREQTGYTLASNKELL